MTNGWIRALLETKLLGLLIVKRMDFYWRMWLIIQVGIGKTYPSSSLTPWCRKLKLLLFHLRLQVLIALFGVPLLVGILTSKKLTNWLAWKMRAGPLYLLMVNGFGRWVPSLKFSVLYGNASSKAYRSVECSLPGDWIYLICVPCPYVMKVLKPLLMLLGIAEKPRFFGTPYLAPPLSASLFYGSSLKDWLRLNCCCSWVSSLSNISWGTIFSFGIWSLWIRRNNVIFRNERQPCNLRTDAIARAT